MPQGKIVKTSSTLFTVRSAEGLFLCRPRGRFRLDGLVPLAGDNVIFEPRKDGSGVLTEILPRKNALVRPPVANVERLVIVISAAPPITAQLLIDSMTALAAFYDIEPILCLNKTDLDPGEAFHTLYSSLGYKMIAASAVTGQGLEELREAMRGAFCVLTGNSGVGKSSIMNALFPGFDARTGALSERIGRGRQTTRHVELIETDDGGFIADTPGYSSFDAIEMEMTDPKRLQFCFPEFEPYLGSCRYSDCAHAKDDDCAVRAAVTAGKIDAVRHESYVRLYNRVKDLKEWEK